MKNSIELIIEVIEELAQTVKRLEPYNTKKGYTENKYNKIQEKLDEARNLLQETDNGNGH